MQALFSMGTEGGVGNVLGASLYILANNHPGSDKIREIHCNCVAGMAGVWKVAYLGHTLQW